MARVVVTALLAAAVTEVSCGPATDLSPSEARSRSMRTSLDQVLNEVKMKLKHIFSSPNVKIKKHKRLIKTPIEAMLPESWFSGDNDFHLPDMSLDIPRDVEIQIEDLDRRWERGNTIADIDRDSFLKKPRKTRVRKKQRLKTKIQDKRNQTSRPESKIYFTQIIRDRPVSRPDGAPPGESRKQSGREINHTTDILDSYSPYIYAELLKENKTNFVVMEDLTEKRNSTESVVVNEIDVYEEVEEEILDSDVAADEAMVKLEVAVVDSVDYHQDRRGTNHTSSFLPFIPPSGINFEDDFEFTVIGDTPELSEGSGDSDNDSFAFGDFTPFSRPERGAGLRLRSAGWAVPAVGVAGAVVALLAAYELSVLVSLSAPLPLTSHCLLAALLLAAAAAALLTLAPSPLVCAATRLVAPLAQAATASCLLVKLSFLVILGTRDQQLRPAHQLALLLALVSLQLCLSCYLLAANTPDTLDTLDTLDSLDTLEARERVCAAPLETRLRAHLYSVVVMAVTVLLSLRYHEVRARLPEARCVGLAALLLGPVWVGWVVAGLAAPAPATQDLATVLGLLLTVAVTFLVMFVLIRLAPDSGGFSDCYKHASKLRYFSLCPGDIRNKYSCLYIEQTGSINCCLNPSVCVCLKVCIIEL